MQIKSSGVQAVIHDEDRIVNNVTNTDPMLLWGAYLWDTLVIYRLQVIRNYVLHFGNWNGVVKVMTKQYILNSKNLQVDYQGEILKAQLITKK
jgi:hypothetical protein